MTATVYVHSDKESNYDTGQRLGLTGEALDMFLFACCEVKLTLDVDPDTGLATITHVDDRPVEAA